MVAAHLLFSLLGWKLSAGEKQKDFAEMFTALGVTFDVGKLPSGGSVIKNAEKRTADMIEFLLKLRKAGRISAKEVEVLRGRLQFMETQTFGKIGKQFLDPCSMAALKESL